MDNATIVAIVTCLITGLLSAGGWKFYEAVLRQKSEQRKEEKNERLAYRDDLIKRVERLEDDLYGGSWRFEDRICCYEGESSVYRERKRDFKTKITKSYLIYSVLLTIYSSEDSL